MKKKSSVVEKRLRLARGATDDAQRALDRGNCEDAIDQIAYAYDMYGEAKGYALALREVKGRDGYRGTRRSTVEVPKLFNTKARIRRACELKR